MPIAIGAMLAFVVGVFATMVGFDRERAFYATVLLVVASLYVLFAAMGGSTHALIVECVPMLAFIALAAVGFRTSQWLVVAGLLGHGIFDMAHRQLISNPGVPQWWAGFCASYDIIAAAYLAVLLHRNRQRIASAARNG